MRYTACTHAALKTELIAPTGKRWAILGEEPEIYKVERKPEFATRVCG